MKQSVAIMVVAVLIAERFVAILVVAVLEGPFWPGSKTGTELSYMLNATDPCLPENPSFGSKRVKIY